MGVRRRAPRPEHGHGGAHSGRRRAHHRRPVRRGQGAHRRVHHHQSAGSRLRARMGPQAHQGDHPPSGGAAVPGRSQGVMPGVPALPTSEIERVFREEYGRAVAVLVGVFGDIDVAEEAVQDAFTAAVQRWPSAGLPPSPAGWIITCCHPALATNVQVALTLRLLGGLTTAEIARAFLVPEPTMAQRLVRAKGKIRDARIPYRVPDEADLPDRLRAVLAVVYLIFNEGYTASAGDRLLREDLCAEAIRLGLLLADQDRARWDRGLIAEGQAIVRRCLRRNQPGPYQIQAAINAVHSDAPAAAATDWSQILQLYDQLLSLAPSPVVALHRAVAVAEVSGPDAALALVDGLDLDGYHLFHAIRADLLRRQGRNAEAALAYEAAIARTENAAEREFLRRSRQALSRAR